MAEIKNNFSQGKMNKDLDERLVPNGQYRDAMNIKVSTSDDSDVGTVQNILGNVNFSKILNDQFVKNLIQFHYLTYKPFCVGTVHDEKNNQVYWLVNFYLVPSQATHPNPNIEFNYENFNINNLSVFEASQLNQIFKSTQSGMAFNDPRPNINGRVLDFHDLFIIPTLDIDEQPNRQVPYDFLDTFNVKNVSIDYNFINVLEDSKEIADNDSLVNENNPGYYYPNFFVSQKMSTLISKKFSCIFRLNQDQKFSQQLITGQNLSFDSNYPILNTDDIDIVFIDHNEVLGLFPKTKNNYAINSDDTYNYINSIDPLILGRYSGVNISGLGVDDSIPLQIDNKLITGINIIDDMLFFTNNLSEPKKINISKSIKGSTHSARHERISSFNYNVSVNSQRQESSLFNPINHTKLVDVRKNKYFIENNFDLPVCAQEQHVTVIKKSPKNAPLLEMSKNNIVDDTGTKREYIGGTFNNVTRSGVVRNFTFNDVVQGSLIRLNLNHPDLSAVSLSSAFSLQVGDQVVIDVYRTANPPDFPLKDFLVKGNIEIIDSSGNNFANGWILSVRVTAISSETPLGLDVNNAPFNFALSLFVDEEKLFKFKFPRFSYRYKYIDGEYSCFAPFSEIAFLPGNFDYHPRKGFNLGMVNQLNKLYIKEFVTEDIPKDVESIDLLYKETGSNNVYILDTLRPDDANLNSFPYNGNFNEYNYENNVELKAQDGLNPGNPSSDVFFSKKRKGYYEVKSETIYALLPSNQLLRPFDNVPIRSYSQEITANRLIYGNYIQNYNLLTGDYAAFDFNDTIIDKDNSPSDVVYKTNIKVSLKNFVKEENLLSGFSYKSVKSLREYQVGVVYTDEYGRQTPVFTNSSARVKIPKSDADNSNQIVAQLQPTNEYSVQGGIKFLAPFWAKGFRFYVKEVSGEYYNLAMDRYYDAEDGNIWLAFPSVDRNKVDIDTFLILKKGIEKNEVVTEKARYKIIDISNEAPDFIKKIELPVGVATHNDSNLSSPQELFGSPGSVSRYPQKGGNSIELDIGLITNTSLNSIKKIASSENEELFLRFEHTDTVTNTTTVSKKYRVAEVGANVSGGGVIVTGSNVNITIEDEFTRDVNFIFDTSPPNFSNSSNMAVKADVKVVFSKAKVENRPQFDGRFFVKIHNDIDAQVQLGSNTSARKYRVLSSRTFYYLSRNHVALHSNVTGVTHTSAPGINTVDYHTDGIHFENSGVQPLTSAYQQPSTQTWPPSYTLGNAGVPIPDANFWYKFTAFFRQKAEHNINARVNHNDGDKTSLDNFEDIWFVDGHPGAGSFRSRNHISGVLDNALSSGTQHKPPPTNGIDGNEIEIAIGGLEPKSNLNLDYEEFKVKNLATISNQTPNYYTHEQNSTTVNWWGSLSSQQTASIYDIGDINKNNKYSDETDFVGALKPGSKIRWKNDPNQEVYTIVSIEDKYKLRYSADFLGNHYYRPENFSKNWKLTLDRNLNWNPVANGNFNGFSRNTDAYTDTGAATGLIDGGSEVLEILEEVYDEVLLSENPAIWETEPKDEVGLDVYYQASKEYPVKLNKDNINNVVKVGGKVKLFNFTTQEYMTYNGFVYGTKFSGASELPNIQVLPNLLGFTNLPSTAFGFGTDTFLLEVETDDTSIFFYVEGITTLNDSFHEVNSLTIDPSNNQPYKVRTSNVVINPYIHDSSIELNWHNCYSFANGVESNRIQDTFNKTFIDNGAIASTTLAPDQIYKQDKRKYGLIYSDLYNSTSNVNNLNQFIQAQNITKEINPIYGSIQKLFSRDSDLVAFCEDRVLRILADKDAVFEADGNSQLVSTNNVLGQVRPFVGDYGISQNPESFAKESYRAYFADKQRGAVLRLSMDGLTAISDAGMTDWFGDNIQKANKIIGTYDQDKSNYNITLLTEASIISAKQADRTNSISNSVFSYNNQLTKLPFTLAELPVDPDQPGEFTANLDAQAAAAQVAQARLGLSASGTSGLANPPASTSALTIGTTSPQLPSSSAAPVQPSAPGFNITSSIDYDTQTPYGYALVNQYQFIDSIQEIGFTLSYDEKVKGWVSFKSYIPELGVSSANKYYTFNNGDIYLHHVEKVNVYKKGVGKFNSDATVTLKDIGRNTFYGEFTNSSVTFIFNQEPSIIKEFRTLNYEGSQSKIDEFIDERNIRLDNLSNKEGWYSSKITTEKQTGNIPEFINKEDKWFNYVKGETSTLENLDSSEFSFQGIGFVNKITAPSTGSTGPRPSNFSCSLYLNPILVDVPDLAGNAFFLNTNESLINYGLYTNSAQNVAFAQGNIFECEYEFTYKVDFLDRAQASMGGVVRGVTNDINNNQGMTTFGRTSNRILNPNNIRPDFPIDISFNEPGEYRVTYQLKVTDLLTAYLTADGLPCEALSRSVSSTFVVNGPPVPIFTYELNAAGTSVNVTMGSFDIALNGHTMVISIIPDSAPSSPPFGTSFTVNGDFDQSTAVNTHQYGPFGSSGGLFIGLNPGYGYATDRFKLLVDISGPTYQGAVILEKNAQATVGGGPRQTLVQRTFYIR